MIHRKQYKVSCFVNDQIVRKETLYGWNAQRVFRAMRKRYPGEDFTMTAEIIPQ